MKKIAIVNRTNLKNFGSVLQVYALYSVVKKLGYDAEVIWENGNMSKNYDFRLNKILSTGCKLVTHPKLLKSTLANVRHVQQHVITEETVQMFDSFVENYINRVYYPAKDFCKNIVGSKYSKFICGSDQIWCSTTLYVDPLMYLRFAPKNKRIAYAPSIGRDYIPNYNKRKMRSYINDIPYVSIREDIGQKLIFNLTNRDVPVVLDPTLLLSFEEWCCLRKIDKGNKDYILCYFLSTPTEDTQKKIIDFVKRKNKFVIALNCKLEYLNDVATVIYPNCGPQEFLGYVSNAEYVFTDSYHGMLFSILFKRQFWSIAREYGEYDQSSRQLSVLKMFGLTNRYCVTNSNISEEVIDYEILQIKLESEKSKSISFLKKSLES